MIKRAIDPLDLLRKLGDHYRHVEQEHQRQPLRSATRHRIATQMHDLQDQFERLLVEWVVDEGLRAPMVSTPGLPT